METMSSPSMQGAIGDIFNTIKSWVNPSALSANSIEGIVIICLLILIIYKATAKLGDFLWWGIGVLFVIQLCYSLGFTTLNNYIPFRDIFTFDVIAAPAQLFPNTPFADALLYASSFCHWVAGVVSDVIIKLIPETSKLGSLISGLIGDAPWR